MKIDRDKVRIILRWADFTALTYAIAIVLFIVIEFAISGTITWRDILDILITISFFGGFIVIVGAIAYVIFHKKDDNKLH